MKNVEFSWNVAGEKPIPDEGAFVVYIVSKFDSTATMNAIAEYNRYCNNELIVRHFYSWYEIDMEDFEIVAWTNRHNFVPEGFNPF